MAPHRCRTRPLSDILDSCLAELLLRSAGAGPVWRNRKNRRTVKRLRWSRSVPPVAREFAIGEPAGVCCFVFELLTAHRVARERVQLTAEEWHMSNMLQRFMRLVRQSLAGGHAVRGATAPVLLPDQGGPRPAARQFAARSCGSHLGNMLPEPSDLRMLTHARVVASAEGDLGERVSRSSCKTVAFPQPLDRDSAGRRTSSPSGSRLIRAASRAATSGMSGQSTRRPCRCGARSRSTCE